MTCVWLIYIAGTGVHGVHANEEVAEEGEDPNEIKKMN
jgi:hypothetical protein